MTSCRKCHIIWHNQKCDISRDATCCDEDNNGEMEPPRERDLGCKSLRWPRILTPSEHWAGTPEAGHAALPDSIAQRFIPVTECSRTGKDDRRNRVIGVARVQVLPVE